VKLGERRVARRRRGTRELEALDLLEPELPACAGVLERLDANHERTALRRDIDDGVRRASGVEQAAAVSDDEMPKLAGRERRVRRGVLLAGVDGCVAHEPWRLTASATVTWRCWP
jgi:hypothetical protein